LEFQPYAYNEQPAAKFQDIAVQMPILFSPFQKELMNDNCQCCCIEDEFALLSMQE